VSRLSRQRKQPCRAAAWTSIVPVAEAARARMGQLEKRLKLVGWQGFAGMVLECPVEPWRTSLALNADDPLDRLALIPWAAFSLMTFRLILQIVIGRSTIVAGSSNMTCTCHRPGSQAEN
jgi:hypothetical protein